MPERSGGQRTVDLITFPLRAVTLFHEDRWHLSSLATERYDYVSREVQGYCLDVGCGRHNRFIREFRRGDGRGIDLFAYEGLVPDEIVESLTTFPFADGTFRSVTFIANLNHCPRPDRDRELAEAYRVLASGGNVIVTMGHPLAELAVHKVVWLYDRLFSTNLDMDSERGMQEGEEYYLLDSEIRERLARAGFQRITKKWFWTQWGLNHLFVGWKDAGVPVVRSD